MAIVRHSDERLLVTRCGGTVSCSPRHHRESADGSRHAQRASAILARFLTSGARRRGWRGSIQRVAPATVDQQGGRRFGTADHEWYRPRVAASCQGFSPSEARRRRQLPRRRQKRDPMTIVGSPRRCPKPLARPKPSTARRSRRDRERQRLWAAPYHTVRDAATPMSTTTSPAPTRWRIEAIPRSSGDTDALVRRSVSIPPRSQLAGPLPVGELPEMVAAAGALDPADDRDDPLAVRGGDGGAARPQRPPTGCAGGTAGPSCSRAARAGTGLGGRRVAAPTSGTSSGRLIGHRRSPASDRSTPVAECARSGRR